MISLMTQQKVLDSDRQEAYKFTFEQAQTKNPKQKENYLKKVRLRDKGPIVRQVHKLQDCWGEWEQVCR